MVVAGSERGTREFHVRKYQGPLVEKASRRSGIDREDRRQVVTKPIDCFRTQLEIRLGRCSVREETQVRCVPLPLKQTDDRKRTHCQEQDGDSAAPWEA
jgi:hypothetical protein